LGNSFFDVPMQVTVYNNVPMENNNFLIDISFLSIYSLTKSVFLYFSLIIIINELERYD
jgi:hypothetical protein